MAEATRVAVLLSGGGTSLQNILDRIEASQLDARVVVVVSSRSDAYALVRARNAGIPAVVVPSRTFNGDWEAMSQALTAELDKHTPDLVVMAGFMCFYHVPSHYEHRVMNIHPALIPSFCGHGMYGHFVHKAVLDAGAKVSGCTVHFADNQYDHGPVIIQRTCVVEEDDTPDTLQQRVFREECEAYPAAIQLFAEDRLRIDGHRVRILAP